MILGSVSNFSNTLKFCLFQALKKPKTLLRTTLIAHLKVILKSISNIFRTSIIKIIKYYKY